MFRGLHTLRGRLYPIRPQNVSAPCAKFELVLIKIQQAKILREILYKVHALRSCKGLHNRFDHTSAITISLPPWPIYSTLSSFAAWNLRTVLWSRPCASILVRMALPPTGISSTWAAGRWGAPLL